MQTVSNDGWRYTGEIPRATDDEMANRRRGAEAIQSVVEIFVPLDSINDLKEGKVFAATGNFLLGKVRLLKRVGSAIKKGTDCCVKAMVEIKWFRKPIQSVGRTELKLCEGTAKSEFNSLQHILGAKSQTGNFNIGSLSRTQMDQVGLDWVGKGASPMMKGSEQIGWVAEGGMKTYRFPALKQSGVAAGEVQGNLTEYVMEGGRKVVLRNAHINLVK